MQDLMMGRVIYDMWVGVLLGLDQLVRYCFCFCLENSALRHPCDKPLHSASGGGCRISF